MQERNFDNGPHQLLHIYYLFTIYSIYMGESGYLDHPVREYYFWFFLYLDEMRTC